MALNTCRLPHPFALSAADKDGVSATLSMFLLNPQPKDWSFYWNFDELSRKYLSPIASRLAALGRLRAEGQVRYHIRTSAEDVKWSNSDESFVIDDNKLHSYIRMGDSNLVSKRCTLMVTWSITA